MSELDWELAHLAETIRNIREESIPMMIATGFGDDEDIQSLIECANIAEAAMLRMKSEKNKTKKEDSVANADQ